MSENRKLPDNLIEKLIIKGMLTDDRYTANISSVFKNDYFEDDTTSFLFNEISDYFKNYNKLPPKEIIQQSAKDIDKITQYFNEMESVDFDISSHLDFLFDETNKYLKEQAVKDAFMKGVDLIEKKQNPNEFRYLLEEALAKDLNIDLGIDYWGQLKERLRRIFTESKKVIPSGYPLLDEYISGGFPPYTLSVFLAKIHGFKSTFLINMVSRQALMGYNPVILSLEMSEDAICQRLDSIYSGMDINRMYLSKKNRAELTKSLKQTKDTEGMGTVIVKEFPTGNASTADFSTFLRELRYRGIKAGPIYCDYLNLMKPEYKNKGDLYQDMKSVSEQLRALSLKENEPVVSVSQLNRCLSLDTNVDIIRDGVSEIIEIKEIKDIKEGDKIKSNNGYNDIIKKWPIEETDILEVETETGHIIKCSKNHRFPSYNDNGEFMGNMTIMEIENKNLNMVVE